MFKIIQRENSPALLLVVISLLMNLGCKATTEGLVGRYYRSEIGVTEYANFKNPITIRINDLKSDPPSERGSIAAQIFIKLFPLISLIPMHQIYINKVIMDDIAILGNDEVEKILINELRDSGIVKGVTYKGEAKDYDLNGEINFTHKENVHCCGFGLIAFSPPTIWSFILPAVSQEFTCKARFDLVSTDGEKIILSKDYTAKSNWQFFMWYDQDRVPRCYGQEVFPQIVKLFIADLKALPRAAWIIENEN